MKLQIVEGDFRKARFSAIATLLHGPPPERGRLARERFTFATDPRASRPRSVHCVS
jgi:hypothetical protein